MLSIYNKKSIPTEARASVHNVLERLKLEEVMKTHNIDINFVGASVYNGSKPISPEDVTCVLDIGIDLNGTSAGELVSSDMRYSIKCSTTKHIDSIDIDIAHEVGRAIFYIDNFETVMQMVTDIEAAGKYTDAFELVRELYASYYSYKIMDDISYGYTDLKACQIYETMSKLIEGSSFNENALDSLIEVNTSLTGMMWNIANWVPPIKHYSVNTSLFMSGDLGETVRDFEAELLNLLEDIKNQNGHGVIELSGLDRICQLTSAMKEVYK